MAHIQDRRKQGRGWVARYRGPDGREHAKSFERKVDAEHWMTTQQAAHLRGEWVDPALGRITLADYVAEWRSTIVNLRPSSMSRKLGVVDNYILPRLGASPLSRITATDAQAFISELQAADTLAPATVRKIGLVLKTLMSDAADAGYIARSPCTKLRLPQESSRKMVFLEPAEVRDLAEAIEEHYRTLVYAAAYTGLRWGELAGLRVERLNLLQRRVHVAEQLTEVSGELAWGPPKTPAAVRTVTLPRFLVTMLEGQLASAPVQASSLVFPSPEGKPLRRSNFRRRAWARATRAVDREGLRFHDLRHTAVAFAIDQGAHPKAIQERMGHSSITTTMDRYGHLFPRLDEAIAEGLDTAFQDASRTRIG